MPAVLSLEQKKRYSQEPDFKCRYTADFTKLENLLKLSESDFLRTFEGSPIRRIGYESFLRNTIIAAGNSANTQYLPVLEDIATRTQTLHVVPSVDSMPHRAR